MRVFCHCASQTLPSLQGIQVKIDKSKKKNKNKLQYAAIQGVVWCASRKILVASGVASRLHREKDDIKQQTKATDWINNANEKITGETLILANAERPLDNCCSFAPPGGGAESKVSGCTCQILSGVKSQFPRCCFVQHFHTETPFKAPCESLKASKRRSKAFFFLQFQVLFHYISIMQRHTSHSSNLRSIEQ